MFEIKFYRTNDAYGCFSNFAKYPINIDNKEWPTSEHYFQAKKFEGTIHEEEIRHAPNAMEAARMGRDRTRPLRKDWEKVKDSIMKLAVQEKVNQHKKVKEILLSTGNCKIIEHTNNDSYWGDNGDGTGKNMLGQILMEIRNSLSEYTGVFYLPQWIVYPDIHPVDMFWRMGKGEDYVMKLAEWFNNLKEEVQEEYNSYFIPPKEWEEIL